MTKLQWWTTISNHHGSGMGEQWHYTVVAGRHVFGLAQQLCILTVVEFTEICTCDKNS